MNNYEIITITAILIGPILAVQVDKFIARNRDTRNRKLSIFKTLMATRSATLSYQHVEALNRIDLEFKGSKYIKVVNAWNEYLDELSQPNDYNDKTVQRNILERREEYLALLLFEMGKTLGYNFDKVTIKRNAYTPQGHVNIESENQFIRKGLIDIIQGKLTIPMTIEGVGGDPDEETVKAQKRQATMQDLIIEYYQRENEIRRKAIEDGSNNVK